MTLFKCKMCGGDLNIDEGMRIVECDYCGTQQTVPNSDDEKKVNLFNRANRLRIAGEFDRAAGVYESLVAEFEQEAEAYWGLCLCKYGIEYVDDPGTARKIPTCHRTSFESILNDNNFQLALSYSDALSRGLYQSEAQAIDALQKRILNIVHNEKPFDVFICYKETDRYGSRTVDSVIAQDIYDHLTEMGFKVFFSRITLEDKIGQEYEPYIFAALNSAKVMLAIATDCEYYDAVWVKNEWKRFLLLMQDDHNKTLIPCYRDIDPYDMPPEFKYLQGQDMGKLGFIQDLVRGITKIVRGSVEVRTTTVNTTAGMLTKRGYIFLEDEDFKSAAEYFNKALDQDPEDSKAYVGVVLARLHLTDISDIEDGNVNLYGDKDFERAIRFAVGTEKAQLEEIKERTERKWFARCLMDTIIHETEKRRKEEELAKPIYSKACAVLRNSTTPQHYVDAAMLFESIREYKDSAEQANICWQKRKECVYHQAISLLQDKNIVSMTKAAELFETIPGYKDASDLAVKCWADIKILEKEVVYNEAVEKVAKQTSGALMAAARLFESISSFRDSAERAKECVKCARNLRKKEKIYDRAKQILDDAKTETEYIEAASLFETIPGFKDADVLVQECYLKGEEVKKEIILNNVKRKMKTETVLIYEDIIKTLEKLVGWEKADELLVICKTKLEELKAKEKQERIELEKRIEREKQEREKNERCTKIITIVMTLIVVTVIASVIILKNVIIPARKEADFIATYGQEVYDRFGLVEVGAYITFGEYEQDNDTSNGKEEIEWVVLDITDGKVLLISKYALDNKPYDAYGQKAIWETCTLRNWLNNEFVNTAFSNEEKMMIPTVSVSADRNPGDEGMDPGNITQDQVFLLSIVEAEKYFDSNEDRACSATAYAEANGARNAMDGNNSNWWLRTRGQNNVYQAAGVGHDGDFLFGYVGMSTDYDRCAVRPALWIDLKS